MGRFTGGQTSRNGGWVSQSLRGYGFGGPRQPGTGDVRSGKMGGGTQWKEPCILREYSIGPEAGGLDLLKVQMGRVGSQKRHPDHKGNGTAVLQEDGGAKDEYGKRGRFPGAWGPRWTTIQSETDRGRLNWVSRQKRVSS